ncbi:MAG: SPOR domain-containing protein [Pseudomonadota bacterium]
MMGLRFSLAPLLALMVFAVCGVVVWLAHIEAGEMTALQGPPIVKAASTPIKRAPDDPGGSVVASLGGVGDLLNDQPVETEENLLPRAEQPVAPGPAELNNGQDQAATALNALLAEVRNGASPASADGSGGPNPDLPVTFPSPRRPSGSPGATDPELTVSRVEPPRAVSNRSRAVDEPDQAVLTAASPIFQTAAEGRFRVQLAAVRDEKDAQRAWDIFQDQIGPFVAGLEPFFERAETSNGVFYRLQVGPFGEDGEANRLCVELKKQDVSCFVVSR